ncbi:hypothetical protein Tco_0332042 [Tanacetum coccineum]
MHNIGNIIGELHALLIEYEKGLPKKAATSQVLAVQGGRIHKSNKKSQNAKGKGKGKGKGKDCNTPKLPRSKNRREELKLMIIDEEIKCLTQGLSHNNNPTRYDHMMIKDGNWASYGLYKPIVCYLFNMYNYGLRRIALDDDDDDVLGSCDEGKAFDKRLRFGSKD